jgi:hypothetical protein
MAAARIRDSAPARADDGLIARKKMSTQPAA